MGESTTISKPMVRSAQTVHLSCVKISTISKQTEMSFHLSFVTKENSRVRPKLFLRLAQTVHLSCTYTNTISKQTETKFGMTHIT
jgi:organic hydroperoxide reductase OsmC/OhrA